MNTMAIAGAVACLVFLAWVTVGYPLWLAWRTRSPQPVHKHFTPRTVTAIVPARNGEHYIGKKLQSIRDLDYPRELLQVIVVSDGSTDRTEEIVRGFEEVELLSVPAGGKPAALTAAFPRSRGEILFLTDVRQPVDPGSLKLLVACFADAQVGAVSGELLIFKEGAQAAVDLYWRFESWMRRKLSDRDSMFGATGPFYALRRDLAVAVPAEVLLDDMYLPLAAFFRGYRLIVEPAALAWDYPTSIQTEFRRKVRTLAGNYQLLKYYPQLLGPRNRMWFDYMSYKLGRLLMPWALLALLAFSFGLPGVWRTVALSAQGVGYGLALLDPVVGPFLGPLRKLSAGMRAFVTMMAAALLAVSVFFVSPGRFWKVTSTKPPAALQG